MAPDVTQLEAETRQQIDQILISCGWVVQDKKRINLVEKLGVAVREMDTDTGPAEYMLFVDGVACGIIEAKREGSGLRVVPTGASLFQIMKNFQLPGTKT